MTIVYRPKRSITSSYNVHPSNFKDIPPPLRRQRQFGNSPTSTAAKKRQTRLRQRTAVDQAQKRRVASEAVNRIGVKTLGLPNTLYQSLYPTRPGQKTPSIRPRVRKNIANAKRVAALKLPPNLERIVLTHMNSTRR